MSRSDRHRGRASRDDRGGHGASSSYTRSGPSRRHEHHRPSDTRHARQNDENNHHKSESTALTSRHDKRQCTAQSQQQQQQAELPKHRLRTTLATAPPRTPVDFYCHICSNNHWTVRCPQLEANPAAHPLMDAHRGCWRCGRRGHNAAMCTIKKYKCRECGGLHDTKDCAYDHVAEDWHEFVDVRTQHPFYTNADETEVQWTRPTHELDVVLWYCPACALMIPDKLSACVKCHTERPALRCARDGVGVASDSDDGEEERVEEEGEETSSASANCSSISSRSASRRGVARALNSDDEEEEESEESLPSRY